MYTSIYIYITNKCTHVMNIQVHRKVKSKLALTYEKSLLSSPSGPSPPPTVLESPRQATRRLARAFIPLAGRFMAKAKQQEIEPHICSHKLEYHMVWDPKWKSFRFGSPIVKMSRDTLIPTKLGVHTNIWRGLHQSASLIWVDVNGIPTVEPKSFPNMWNEEGKLTSSLNSHTVVLVACSFTVQCCI